MPSPTQELVLPHTHFSTMLNFLHKNLRRLCSHLRWPLRRRCRTKLLIRRFGKSNTKPNSNNAKHDSTPNGSNSTYLSNGHLGRPKPGNPIRVATFNAALFAMAPAAPKPEKATAFPDENGDSVRIKRTLDVNLRAKSLNDRPKSILKQSPLHPNSLNGTESLSTQQKFVKSKLRVSINLPDNEISLLRNRRLSFADEERQGSCSSCKNGSKGLRGKGCSLRPSVSFIDNSRNGFGGGIESFRSSRTVLDVLRELEADILALQDVKAEEENAMKPLSDLANGLGMDYVFAESWAPEYGNAILSKWPIKHWKVQKIFDDTDFRNVLKATIDVPQVGEVNFYCTHLDHLDENWRMKQIDAIIQSNEEPHILAGGLNSLDETDYSEERWTDIVKYYEEMGKPTPKLEVMRHLKNKQYTDSKDFAGECESVVVIAKGQSVQGTCKYGTRVDYILSSPNSPYKFVPGSYSVLSSKGTSDHHIVKVDIIKFESSCEENAVTRKRKQPRQRVVKVTHTSPSKGIWKTHTHERDRLI